MKKLVFVAMMMVLMVFTLNSTVWATPLVYQFIFPSFGGNPYNASWLMANAEKQGPRAKVVNWWETDPLTTFKKELERQMFSRLSSKIISDVFGDTSSPNESMKPGKWVIGSYEVNVSTDLVGITISVVDPATGNSTVVVVPYY